MRERARVSAGFVAIRRGIEEHLLSGNLGFFEMGVYLVIHLQASFRTGVWTGSAPRLAATAPRGANVRDVQRALQRLEEIGFIRSFHQQGARGNYRVLIDKYEPTTGALKGKRLNAAKSGTWQRPHYEPRAVTASVNGGEDEADTGSEAAPYQEERGEGKNIRAENLVHSFADDACSAALKELNAIVANVPVFYLCDPHSFHDAVQRSLKAHGWVVEREWNVCDRGDGRPGSIDLVVTSPYRIGIELDRGAPRDKSLLKLSRFEGLRVIVLRGRKGEKPSVIDVTGRCLLELARQEVKPQLDHNGQINSGPAPEMTPKEISRAIADAREKLSWPALAEGGLS
jgi:hypothetical protein